MKIAVLGAGVVGRAVAEGFSLFGNEVLLYDTNAALLNQIKALPSFSLPSSPKIVASIKKAVSDAEIAFVTVDTASRRDGNADSSNVLACVRSIAKYCAPQMLIVIKSTVPPGTCNTAIQVATDEFMLRNIKALAQVVSNPEFLREGSELSDFMRPKRIVMGGSLNVINKLKTLYKPFLDLDVPVITTDTQTAELIKFACNGFLSIKIAYVNELADLCQAMGANLSHLLKALSLDSRIGSEYLNPGPGFGGNYLPKDSRAFVHSCAGIGMPSLMVTAALNANRTHMRQIVAILENELPELNTKRIGILGLSYKNGVASAKESAALKISGFLLDKKARVAAHDPMALNEALVLEPRLERCDSPYDAAKEANALLILTAWDEYRLLDIYKIARLMAGHIILDCCSVLDSEAVHTAGLKLIGR